MIFKKYVILVQGKSYFPEDFIKLLRNTTDGAKGHSIIETNKTLISIMYNNMKYEETLVKTGGNKKRISRIAKEIDSDTSCIRQYQGSI